MCLCWRWSSQVGSLPIPNHVYNKPYLPSLAAINLGPRRFLLAPGTFKYCYLERWISTLRSNNEVIIQSWALRAFIGWGGVRPRRRSLVTSNSLSRPDYWPQICQVSYRSTRHKCFEVCRTSKLAMSFCCRSRSSCHSKCFCLWDRDIFPNGALQDVERLKQLGNWSRV